MAAPFITRCSDWHTLLTALRARRECEFLSEVPHDTATAVLAAPAVLALWIAARAPQLAARAAARTGDRC